MYQKLLLRCPFCWNLRSRKSWLRTRPPLPQWQQPVILPATHRGNETDTVTAFVSQVWGVGDDGWRGNWFFGWLEKNNCIRKSMCSLKGWCKWFKERKRNSELFAGGGKKHSGSDLVTALLGDGNPPPLLWWVANARNVKQRVQSIMRQVRSVEATL